MTTSESKEELLSFDRHLRHAFAPLSSRLEAGIKSLDGIIEILRLRIEAEASFASGLEKIICNDKLLSSVSSLESLRIDGLDALHADLKNEYQQHIEFVNSLNEDIYEPCISMRELYASKNRLFANNTKQNIKSLRQQQNQFYKIKTKYEKVCKDASNARTLLLNAKLDNKISSQQILKLGTKVNSTLKTQQIWKEKYDQQSLIWNKQQIKFDDEMTAILQGMQTNEYNRMKIIKDSLNKLAVFITNLCANRNYDCKNLAESMSLINIEKDLQIFIKNTLKHYPSNNTKPQQPPQQTKQNDHLHFSKQQQNALTNLNKVSQTKNNYNYNHSSSNHQRGQSSSFSSFSITNHRGQHYRNNSNSLSSISIDTNTNNNNNNHNNNNNNNKLVMRQQSTPNSIGSFFKQKFQKQKSYNSTQSLHSNNNANMRRENSRTISSYTRQSSITSIDNTHHHHDVVVAPQDDDDDDDDDDNDDEDDNDNNAPQRM